MRILLAHNSYKITGGADVFYHDVGRLLSDRGHEVAYFSSAEQDQDQSSQWHPYFPKSADYNSGSLASRLIAFPSMVYSRPAKKQFERLISDFQPDIIHAFAIYTRLTPSILDAATRHKIPVVMSCNDYKLICPNYSLYHHGHICEECKGGSFYRAIVNRCGHDSLVFSTGIAIEAYVQNYLDIYRKNIDTFLFESEYSAKKTEEFWGKNAFRWKLILKPFNSAERVISNKTSDYCLYAGRLHDSKGVHILLQAMQFNPETHLIIAGDGPDRCRLEAMKDDLGLQNVTFCGWKTRDEVAQLMKLARFAIVPSIWPENFPYVITEAFSYGKPVIGSNRGGIPELVRHKSFGLVYEALSPEQLARAISQLWNDPPLAGNMGRAAKEWCDQRFTDEACYELLQNIYMDAIRRRH